VEKENPSMSTRLTAVAAIGISIVALSALLVACENQDQKVDRELAWRDVNPFSFLIPVQVFA